LKNSCNTVNEIFGHHPQPPVSIWNMMNIVISSKKRSQKHTAIVCEKLV